MEANQNNGIFINGKEQIVELLKALSVEEKEKLINNMKRRDPALAKELSLKSVRFDGLYTKSAEELQKIFEFIPAAVIGLALKGCPNNFQKKVLTAISRNVAGQAFSTMNQPASIKDAERAKARVLDTATQLLGQGIIQSF